MGSGRPILVAAFVLLLSACASSGAEPVDVESPAPPTVVSASPSTVPASPSTSPTPVSAVESPGFTITTHSRDDLQNYSQFTYMTATTTGLSPEAAAVADERIKGMVDSVVSAALADDDGECLEGETKCGYFEQTLKPIPCRDSYLCLEQHVSAAPVGLAISDEQVAVLVLDPRTGRTANLTDVVKASERDAFLAAVNDAVTQVQQSFSVYDASNAPNFTEPDFAAWAPVPEGVRVWFPKYTAGPGAMGVVDVTVPPPGAREAVASAPPTRGPKMENGDGIIWLCYRPSTEMPRLPRSGSDQSGAYTVQDTLTALGYDPGPIDGQYGPVTMRAVEEFQSDYGLVVDGRVGPQTWSQLQMLFCWQYQDLMN